MSETTQQAPAAEAKAGPFSAATVSENRAPAIQVHDLRFNYGDFEAVKGISFEVAPGELFALLGTNGAGKTTTIEVLEGFRRPAKGEVWVLGLDPGGHPAPLRARVNAVLQHSGTYPELSVAETIDLARDLTPRPRPRAEVLEFVDLAEKAATRAGRLSGGERRRLDLALAIVTRPEVMFLDEPTTGMDPEARRATWEVMNRLRSEGTSILLTTHYLEEAERLADRLAIMHHGEIRVRGTLEEVVTSRGDGIAFRLPDAVHTEDLPVLPGEARAEAEVRSGEPWVQYRVHGENDAEERAHHALTVLLRWAEDAGVTLQNLEVRSASLEDVFLSVADGSALAEMGEQR
jgi:ABC-2 type transport system ATP-binding protein